MDRRQFLQQSFLIAASAILTPTLSQIVEFDDRRRFWPLDRTMLSDIHWTTGPSENVFTIPLSRLVPLELVRRDPLELGAIVQVRLDDGEIIQGSVNYHDDSLAYVTSTFPPPPRPDRSSLP